MLLTRNYVRQQRRFGGRGGGGSSLGGWKGGIMGWPKHHERIWYTLLSTTTINTAVVHLAIGAGVKWAGSLPALHKKGTALRFLRQDSRRRTVTGATSKKVNNS